MLYALLLQISPTVAAITEAFGNEPVLVEPPPASIDMGIWEFTNILANEPFGAEVVILAWALIVTVLSLLTVNLFDSEQIKKYRDPMMVGTLAILSIFIIASVFAILAQLIQ